MAIKDIVVRIMHVEHGQKLVDVEKELLMDEKTNGSEKEGEENSKPLANTIWTVKRDWTTSLQEKKGNGWRWLRLEWQFQIASLKDKSF